MHKFARHWYDLLSIPVFYLNAIRAECTSFLLVYLLNRKEVILSELEHQNL